MIIAFPTTTGGLSDSVIPSFGRAPTLTLVILDDDTKEIKEVKVVQNPNTNLPRGAGIQTASYLASLGVNVVITPHIGPNAYQVLVQAGIKVYIGAGIVQDLVRAYLSGQLQEFQPGLVRPGFGPGFGRGMGRGFGRFQ